MMDPPYDDTDYLPRSEALAMIKQCRVLAAEERILGLASEEVDNREAPSEFVEYTGYKGHLVSTALRKLRDGTASSKQRRIVRQKELGDVAYTEGRYLDSVLHYHKATEANSLLYASECYCNQSLALLKLERWSEAANTYVMAVLSYAMVHGQYNQVTPFLVKAHYRGAIARKHLGQYELALRGYSFIQDGEVPSAHSPTRAALKRAKMGDPNSEKITKEMEEVQSLIQYCKRQYDGNPRGEIEARMATHELYGLLRYEADLLLEAGIKPWDGRVWDYLRAAKGDIQPFYRSDLVVEREMPVKGKARKGPAYVEQHVHVLTLLQLGFVSLTSRPRDTVSTKHLPATKIVELVQAANLKPESVIDYVCGTCFTERKASEFLKCGGCLAALYCNKACQRADWKTHKVLCAASANQGSDRPLGNTGTSGSELLKRWGYRHIVVLTDHFADAIDLQPNLEALQTTALWMVVEHDPRSTNILTAFVVTLVAPVYIDEDVPKIIGPDFAPHIAGMKALNARSKESGRLGTGFILICCKMPAGEGQVGTAVQTILMPVYMNEGWDEGRRLAPEESRRSLVRALNG